MNDPRHEFWRHWSLPLGVSLLLNLTLCGALAHISATATPAKTHVTVELVSIASPPSPPPPPRERQSVPPPKPTAAPPPTPEPPRPSLFRRLKQMMRPEAAPAASAPRATPQTESVQPIPTPPSARATESAVAGMPEMPALTASATSARSPLPFTPGPESPPGSGAATGGTLKLATPPRGGGKLPGGGHSGSGPGGDGGTSPSIMTGTDAGPDGGAPAAGAGTTPGGGSGTTPGSGNTPPSTPGTGAGSRGESHGARVSGQSRPPYPPGAREEGVEGVTVLLVSLDPSGNVAATKLEHTSGDSRLDRAAETAVRKWSYTPKLEDGTPVASTIRVRVEFRLE